MRMNKQMWRLSAFVFVAVLVYGASAQLPLLENLATTRQTIDGDGYSGEGYTVMPLLQDEKPATAIIIHGLGGTGEEWGFISLALSFFSLNYVKFIVPSAAEAPVTYLRQDMPSWFDIRSLSSDSADVNRGQLLSSVKRIHNIVLGEVKDGVPENRIFIIGFSQGGAVALTSFLRSRWSLAGCIGVATWLPFPNDYPAQRKNSIKDKDILMLHGTEDIAVQPRFAERSRDKLVSIGQNVNLTLLPGEPHIIVNSAVLNSIEDFIATRAKGTTGYLKTVVKDLTDTFAGLTQQLDSMPRL